MLREGKTRKRKTERVREREEKREKLF